MVFFFWNRSPFRDNFVQWIPTRLVEVPEENKSYFSNWSAVSNYNANLHALQAVFCKELRAGAFRKRLDNVFTHVQKKRTYIRVYRSLLNVHFTQCSLSGGRGGGDWGGASRPRTGNKIQSLGHALKPQSHQAYDQVTINVRSKIVGVILKSQKQRTTCLRGRGRS